VQSPTQRAGPPPQESGPKISRRQATDPRQPNPADVPAALRRRRAASLRCVPLPSGQRDPFTDDHDRPLTTAELASWRAAWRHLHALGLPAVIPRQVVAAGQAHRRGDAA
jgi:hypothetical protein